MARKAHAGPAFGTLGGAAVASFPGLIFPLCHHSCYAVIRYAIGTVQHNKNRRNLETRVPGKLAVSHQVGI